MSETENPILALPMEIRMYLEAKMNEPLTNSEIHSLLYSNYQWVRGIEVAHIEKYRKKFQPNYPAIIVEKRAPEFIKKAAIPQVQDEILEEIKAVDDDNEALTVAEKQKVNQLRAHKKLLTEGWNSYQKIRGTREENAKKSYLEMMSKELEKIAELEKSEKSFMSSLDEIRKAELKMTVHQYYDSLIGWWLPRCMEKCHNTGEALEYLFRFNLFCNDYAKIIMESGTVEEANKVLLDKIYVSKLKIKKEYEKNV